MHVLKFNSQFQGISRVGWRRSGISGAFWVGLMLLWKRSQEFPHSSYHVRKREHLGHLWNRNWALSKHRICLAPRCWDFTTSRTMRNKCILHISYPSMMFCYSSQNGTRQHIYTYTHRHTYIYFSKQRNYSTKTTYRDARELTAHCKRNHTRKKLKYCTLKTVHSTYLLLCFCTMKA